MVSGPGKLQGVLVSIYQSGPFDTKGTVYFSELPCYRTICEMGFLSCTHLLVSIPC